MNPEQAKSSTTDNPALGLVDLARVVFLGSRPLEIWERESLDEFTWAELKPDFSKRERIGEKNLASTREE